MTFVLSKGIIGNIISNYTLFFYRWCDALKVTYWCSAKTIMIWTLPAIGIFADEWDSLDWHRWGCFLDMCRCRLLVPPLSCNVLKQMRQRTAAKSSKRSKWLQIQLCLRPTAWSSDFWWPSAETSWAASWMPVTADIVSATFTKETLSESPSSIDTLKKYVAHYLSTDQLIATIHTHFQMPFDLTLCFKNHFKNVLIDYLTEGFQNLFEGRQYSKTLQV